MTPARHIGAGGKDWRVESVVSEEGLLALRAGWERLLDAGVLPLGVRRLRRGPLTWRVLDVSISWT